MRSSYYFIDHGLTLSIVVLVTKYPVGASGLKNPEQGIKIILIEHPKVNDF